MGHSFLVVLAFAALSFSLIIAFDDLPMYHEGETDDAVYRQIFNSDPSHGKGFPGKTI